MQKFLIVIPLFLVLILAGYVVYNKTLFINKPLATITPEIKESPTSIPGPTTTPQLKNTGVVEGSISFPSETIPSDLVVCAETTNGVQYQCTDKLIKDSKYTYGVGYQLELPLGDYYIYSQAPSMQTGYKAYYNEFVVCGLSVDCPSHNNIVVNVVAGETKTKIDPQDWYNQQ